MKGAMQSIDIRTVDSFPEPAFSRLQRSVFAEVEQYSAELASVLQAEEGAAGAPIRTHCAVFRLGAYDGDELVGWSYGWMERSNVLYMANSGVLASHRGRGIYMALLDAMREYASTEGAWAIRSQHSVLNNPVIIAKLRAGFHVSGLMQSAHMGSLAS
jgi:GNAT superfamily N-acetyltransferase